MAAGLNGLQTDADTVRRLAARGAVTAPGGLPLGSANIVINCPALGFLDVSAQTPSSGADAGGGGTAQGAALAGGPVAGTGGSSPLLPGLAGILGLGLAMAGTALLRRGHAGAASPR